MANKDVRSTDTATPRTTYLNTNANNVPNLDAMDTNELWAICTRANGVRPIKYARELFPTRPNGYVGVTKNIGCYASNKATAMHCRLSGDIITALIYEGIANRIYARLPEYARW